MVEAAARSITLLLDRPAETKPDKRFWAVAGGSAAVHLAVLAWLALPVREVFPDQDVVSTVTIDLMSEAPREVPREASRQAPAAAGACRLASRGTSRGASLIRSMVTVDTTSWSGKTSRTGRASQASTARCTAADPPATAQNRLSGLVSAGRSSRRVIDRAAASTTRDSTTREGCRLRLSTADGESVALSRSE